MGNIRFKNAYILTLSDQDKISGSYVVKKNLDLLVENNKIVFIGSKEEADSFIKGSDKYNAQYFVEYNCDGNLLMPSFKNLHSHSAMNFLRGTADNLPLDKWLKNGIFPAEQMLGQNDVYYFTQLAILEYLQAGITYIHDMYYNLDEVVRAALDMDFRVTLIEGINYNNFDISSIENNYVKYNNLENYLDEFAKLSNAEKKEYNHSLVDYVFSMHSVYMNNDKTFSDLSKIIHKYKAPFAIHNSETKQEVIDCINKYRKTPTELLDNYGLYDFGGFAYHSIYLSDNDINIYKNKNIKVVSCNASNLKLNSGICDIYKYKKTGLNISLGTDGEASNNGLSMFREMYLASVLSNRFDSDVLLASDILDMACKNGVKGYKDDLDSLQVGKTADIILIDLHKANMWPLNNIVSNIVFSANESNVLMTMVDGKILYDKGKFILPKVKHCIFEKSNKHNIIVHIAKDLLCRLRKC